MILAVSRVEVLRRFSATFPGGSARSWLTVGTMAVEGAGLLRLTAVVTADIITTAIMMPMIMLSIGSGSVVSGVRVDSATVKRSVGAFMLLFSMAAWIIHEPVVVGAYVSVKEPSGLVMAVR